MTEKVAVIGHQTHLGRRVVGRLEELGLGWCPLTKADRRSEVRTLIVLGDERTPEKDFLDVDGTGCEPMDRDELASTIERLGSPGQVVLLSTGMVYGPAAHEKLPLTEDLVPRPPAGARFARARLAAERFFGSWCSERSVSLAILRPVLTLAEDRSEWFRRSLWRVGGFAGRDVPPMQALHLDDLASAVVLAVERRLEGTFNVAPDGWMSPDALRDVLGGPGRLGLPYRLAEAVVGVTRPLGFWSTPSEVLRYARADWVLANDRLRSHGWTPSHSTEEAFATVISATGMSARRRQQVALGVTAAVGVAAALTVRLLARKARRSQIEPGSPSSIGANSTVQLSLESRLS
ncbi:MAG: hypothetical protein KatS3mg008_1022 [Acidimicrobiales bacterium]|nr:MAG: hypothetical protein KatS3mg008_1022 [Acidimicrobiales bacterium]